MQIINLTLRKVLIAMSLIVGLSLCAEETTVPCIVASGHSEQTVSVDLSKYKRITFRDDAFTISSPDETANQDIVLPYSDFHHLEFRHNTPITTDINEMEVRETPLFIFDNMERMIKTELGDGAEFNLKVFSSDGRTALTARLSSGNPVSVGHLPSGVYIATGTYEGENLTIKFILK